MEVMESLDRNTVAKSLKRFRSSSGVVIAADGYFIEYSYSQYVPLLIYFYFDEIG
jgi:hypothetical protein